jgi:tetratricopeptide (TPR) repeat protein
MKFLSVAIAALAATTAMPALASRIQAQEPKPAPKAAPGAQAVQGAGQVRASKGALPAIVELQTAVNSNDRAAIAAKAAAAQAVATTKEDRYLIGQLQLKAALAANDQAAMTAAVNTVAGSGYLDSARTAELYRSLGAKLVNDKQYGPGAAMLEKAAALTPGDTQLQMSIADVRMVEGRKGDAAAIYARLIQARQAAGQKPDEALYKRAVQAAYDANLPTVDDLAKQWVTAYPSAESWRNSIGVYRNQAKPDLEGTLDLLRLMHATGALTRSSDLGLYVRILSDGGNFIEAQRVLDAMAPGGEIDAAGLQSLKATVGSKPKVSVADLDAAAKSAQSGMALLRIGDRYYGLGEYAKAAEAYRAAKGRGAEAGLADLRAGIAAARAGDKAGATAALNAVSGPRAGVARYWLLHLQNRG